MRRQFTLKTVESRSVNCRRGVTLLEIVIVLAIMSILGTVGALSLQGESQSAKLSAERLARDIEYCRAMTRYSSYSYSLSFERDGYTILKNESLDEKIEKREKHDKTVEFEKVPGKMSFLKEGEAVIDKGDMTIKLVERKTGDGIYITIVPVSYRVLVTESPSNPF